MPEQSASNQTCKKGDRFVTGRHSGHPMFIEVTRVGKAGWVDIRVFTWAVMWTKRMPKGIAPLLDQRRQPHFVRKDWTHQDIVATAPGGSSVQS